MPADEFGHEVGPSWNRPGAERPAGSRVTNDAPRWPESEWSRLGWMRKKLANSDGHTNDAGAGVPSGRSLVHLDAGPSGFALG